VTRTVILSENNCFSSLGGSPLGVSTPTGTPSIEVAAVGVLAAQHGAEHPSIACAVRLDHMPDRGTVRGQGFRGFHVFFSHNKTHWGLTPFSVIFFSEKVRRF